MRQNSNNIPSMVYQVLDNDTIRVEILPHLSVAKRGFQTASCLIEMVNSILYKLKTGCQWYMLPAKSLFSGVILSYKTAFWTFLDLSNADLDGSHTTTLRGGEEVAYQGRKKRKIANSLYLNDRQGLPLALSSSIAGKYNDLYTIEKSSDVFLDACSGVNISRLRCGRLL